MDAKLREHEEEVLELLEEHGVTEDFLNEAERWIELDADEKIERAKESV